MGNPLTLTALGKAAGKFTIQQVTDQEFVTFVKEFKLLPDVRTPDGQQTAFLRFRGDIIRAIKDGQVDEDLVQEAWNLVCAEYRGNEKPNSTTNGYTLPEKVEKKEKQPSKVGDVVEPNEAEYKNWCQGNTQYIEEFKSWDPHLGGEKEPLKQEEWEHVKISVFLLGQSLPHFRDFFREVCEIGTAIRDGRAFKPHPSKIRVRGLLRLMVPKPGSVRTANSIKGYKGACSEIIDLFRSVTFGHDSLTRIAVPEANKKFTEEDARNIGAYLVKPDEKGKILLEQDIDRTEIRGKIKFYVEVKADPHTAVEKHQKNTRQLDRILAVIRNRQSKIVSPDKAPAFVERHPAVSIVTCGGWLEIFTTGTAINYYKRGFWLFIDKQLIHPDMVKRIKEYVWKEAGVQQPKADALGGDAGTLKSYFDQHQITFDRPSDLLTRAQFK